MSGVLLCPLLFLSESGPRLVVSSSHPPASASPSGRVINKFSYIQLFIRVPKQVLLPAEPLFQHPHSSFLLFF